MSQTDNTLPPEHEADAFFDALAGRSAPSGGVSPLRTALLDELNAVRAAQRPAPPEALSARDAATLAQLLDEGVFAAADAASSQASAPAQRVLPPDVAKPLLADAATPPQPNVSKPPPSAGKPLPAPGLSKPTASIGSTVLTWLGERLQGQSRQYWSAGLAAGFALICVVAILPRGGQSNLDQSDVVRGTAALTIAVAAPETFARALQAGLEAQGARARLVQVNDTQWSLAVSVARAGQGDAIVAYLRGQGFANPGTPPFVLTITKQ